MIDRSSLSSEEKQALEQYLAMIDAAIPKLHEDSPHIKEMIDNIIPGYKDRLSSIERRPGVEELPGHLINLPDGHIAYRVDSAFQLAEKEYDELHANAVPDAARKAEFIRNSPAINDLLKNKSIQEEYVRDGKVDFASLEKYRDQIKSMKNEFLLSHPGAEQYYLDAANAMEQYMGGKCYLLANTKSADAIMAEYDRQAKQQIEKAGWFTALAKQNKDLGEHFLRNLDNTGIGDLEKVVMQSKELSYIKGEDFSKVLGERLKYLGMVNEKQAQFLTELTDHIVQGTHVEFLDKIAKDTAKAEAKLAGEKTILQKIEAMSTGKKWAAGAAVAAVAAVGGWAMHERNKSDLQSQQDIKR